MTTRVLPLLAALVLASPAAADVDGVWLTRGGKSKVRIERCADGPGWCGNIVWLAEPSGADGRPLRDLENRDPALRGRPVLGMALLTGFARRKGDAWSGGVIYNPEDGRNYRAELRRTGARSLEVKGCALRIFCQTQQWSLVP
jgi:uncharacterized protein (DUF2147 family)